MIKVFYSVPATHTTGNQPLIPVVAAATVTGAATSLFGTPEGENLLTFLRGKFAGSQIKASDTIDATHDGQNWTVYKNNVSFGTIAR